MFGYPKHNKMEIKNPQPNEDPLGTISTYILENHPHAEDVIVVAIDKADNQIDLSMACRDLSIDTCEKHKAKLIELLEFILADMKNNKVEKDEGCYFVPTTSNNKRPPEEGEGGQESIIINE